MSARKSRESLPKKRLINSGRGGAFLAESRIIHYGIRNFFRNLWLTMASTIMMIIPLIIIFLTVIIGFVFREVIDAQTAKIDISIFIKYDASDDILRTLSGKLRVELGCDKCVSVSNSAEQYEKIQEDWKNVPDNMNALQTVVANQVEMNPPAIIHVSPRNLETDRAKIENFITKNADFQKWIDAKRMDGISTRENTVKELAKIMTQTQIYGFGLALIFVLISILIIFNTIQMAIFSRREEIEMMKAIGADRKFIRGPFLVEAELYGIIAAIIATALGYLATTNLLPSLKNFLDTDIQATQNILNSWWILILLAMIILGFVIGNISARLAVRKYLKD